MQNTPIQDAIRAYALRQVNGPYIMGATAKKCTPDYRRALASRYSKYAGSIYTACPQLSGKQSGCGGCKWAGLPAHDCAQLSRFAAAAAGIELPSGSNSQWCKVNWAVKGEIASLPPEVVCFVFHRDSASGRMNHVGVYLGDNTVADARGHTSGVVHSALSSYPWTHYAIPQAVAQEAGLASTAPEANSRPMLQKGARGEDVAQAQELLCWAGAQLTVDGVFGSATQAAVASFQAANGLSADGIIGPLTWARLLSVASEFTEPDTEETTEPAEEVVEALIAEVDAAWRRLKEALTDMRSANSGPLGQG